MAETQSHINDRLQWRMSLLEQEMQRLQARVAALETGNPLPPEPKPEITPTISQPQVPAPEHVATAPVAEAPIPDISVGWIGGRRG